jgi:8-oxo-dGTP pyrophosphatase MutT (NUDIX family)
MSELERLGSETLFDGKFVSVRRDRFRHADGEEVDREIVGHPGAVVIVAHDGEQLYLVRQPREAIGDPGLLELPAGKLDVEGEPPLETARRELAEEIGKAAADWKELVSAWSSPGFTDERFTIYLATGLSDREAEAEEDERIEIVPWPLDRLDELIDEVEDSQTLLGLLLFERLHAR